MLSPSVLVDVDSCSCQNRFPWFPDISHFHLLAQVFVGSCGQAADWLEDLS